MPFSGDIHEGSRQNNVNDVRYMKKVIVISTSLRAGSNSDMMADKFIEGALKSGNEVEKISLINKDIRFCRG